MLLLKWDKLPKNLKVNSIKKYYDILDKKRISLFIKRLFDIVVSLILLVILLPLFVVCGILIKIDSRGPIFYRQLRITQYGREFKIYKFRTMINDADKMGLLITTTKDNRITKVGKILRKTKLDELPQFINVLIGDMSFVGTRPEVKKYVYEYTDEMKATLLLPAGITSSASVKYKDENDLIEKATDIDKVYLEDILPDKMYWNLKDIEEFSLGHDLKILLNTFKALI